MSGSNGIHPVLNVYDGVFNSFSGKLISILKPTPEMICLEDIAKGLSNYCRFGGQIHSHYSVAQHTLLVWYLAPDHLKRAALLHDAAEAYLGDVIKPLKVILGSIYALPEAIFEGVIFTKYQVDQLQLIELKDYDNKALEIEHSYFRFNNQYLIELQFEINELLPYSTPHDQLLELLRREFLQNEIGGQQ